MNSDNTVARLDATFENTLHFNAELQAICIVEKNNVLYNTTAGWNSQAELVAKAGYLYVYIDYKQTEDNQDIAGFKVGDNTSLLIDLPFTDSIIYTSIEDIENTLGEIGNAIEGLNINKADKVNPTTSGALAHTGNATVNGSVTATGGFIGNLTGTADSATHATSADSATSANEATHATSADSAISAGNANTVNNLTVLTAVPANAVFTDTTYTLGTDGNTIKLTPSSGSAQSITVPYASNAGTVNSHSVNADVPSGAKFTDTDYLVDLKDVELSNLADGQVLVWDAVARKFKNITLPDAVAFKGSLGTGGTITVLPVDGSARIGDMYKVITEGTYAGQASKIGDTFICLTKTPNANTWVYIPSGDEPSGTVTSVKIEGSGAIVVDDESAITTSGIRTISHANSGAVAGSYGDSSTQTPTYGATFKVPYITVDEKGHITGISEHTVKIPESDNTDELSELTDVSLTSPTQGQILKYNGSIWENADEVEPINVVANPSDAATTDLTKLKVGNSVYSIPQSSGSGGHTIVDNDGTSLAQRTKLQFLGAYSEDNSTDDTTEVNVVREMTKAEFDLLSAAEKTGLINITDITGGNDDRFQPVIYSTEEREIGVWTDGKPLYEKTIYVDSFPNNTSKNLSTPTNLELLVDSFGFMKSKTLTGYCRTLPFAAGGTNDVRVDTNEGTLRVVTFSDWSSYEGYITIRYTKSTDTAGSGQWTPQGVPAVHYSTDEQVVGTWIDGSTLYEKTYHIQALPNGVSVEYETGLSNITPRGFDNILIFPSGNTSKAPYINMNGTVCIAIQFNANGKIYFGANTDQSSTSAYVTLRYTKSST